MTYLTNFENFINEHKSESELSESRFSRVKPDSGVSLQDALPITTKELDKLIKPLIKGRNIEFSGSDMYKNTDESVQIIAQLLLLDTSQTDVTVGGEEISDDTVVLRIQIRGTINKFKQPKFTIGTSVYTPTGMKLYTTADIIDKKSANKTISDYIKRLLEYNSPNKMRQRGYY